MQIHTKHPAFFMTVLYMPLAIIKYHRRLISECYESLGMTSEFGKGLMSLVRASTLVLLDIAVLMVECFLPPCGDDIVDIPLLIFH